MFPEQLLSSHFWSEQQKKDLLDKSILKRQDSILSQTQSATNNDVLHSAITVFQNEVCTLYMYRYSGGNACVSLSYIAIKVTLTYPKVTLTYPKVTLTYPKVIYF